MARSPVPGDIELMINRAVVYGMLAAAITAMYVIMAVEIGSLRGRRER